MNVQLHPYRLPYVRAVRGQTERVGFLVSLRGADGLTGWGEAAPYPGLSRSSLSEVEAAIQGWNQDPQALQACPEALHGLRTALLDLEGKRYGQPLCELLGGICTSSVPVSHLVSDPATAAAAVAAGARCLKLKVGEAALREDLDRIEAIQAVVGPEIQVRVDANRRWPLATAQDAIGQLDELEVDLIEEPTQQPSDMAGLRNLGPKIAADESVRTPDDLEKIIEEGWADVVVLKPMLIGAPETAVAMARSAAAAGLEVVITTTIDSWVGRRTALHIAAAIPSEALLASGLMTGSWLETPLAPDPMVQAGHVAVPSGPGLDLGSWSRP